MRILFDQSAPYRPGRYLKGHSVLTAEECGWDRLTNGELLASAPWQIVRLRIAEIAAAVNAATAGSFVEVDIPLPPKKPFTGL